MQDVYLGIKIWIVDTYLFKIKTSVIIYNIYTNDIQIYIRILISMLHD